MRWNAAEKCGSFCAFRQIHYKMLIIFDSLGKSTQIYNAIACKLEIHSNNWIRCWGWNIVWWPRTSHIVWWTASWTRRSGRLVWSVLNVNRLHATLAADGLSHQFILLDGTCAYHWLIAFAMDATVNNISAHMSLFRRYAIHCISRISSVKLCFLATQKPPKEPSHIHCMKKASDSVAWEWQCIHYLALVIRWLSKNWFDILGK